MARANSPAARLMAELSQLAEDRLLPALPILESRGLVSSEVVELGSRSGLAGLYGNPPAADRVVLQAMQEAGVRVLVLKGTLLAHTVYESPEQRLRSDTDLIIPAEQLAVAQQVLEGLGLTPNRAPMVLTMEAQEGWQGMVQGKPVLIDLHWLLFSHPAFAPLFSFEELWNNRQPVCIDGYQSFGLGPADALLHAAVHYFAHHEEGDRPAQWLLDGDLLWQHLDEATREELVQRAIQLEVAGVVAAYLQAAKERFFTAIDATLLRRLEHAGKHQWRSDILRISGQPLAGQMLILRSFEGKGERLSHLRRMLLPTKAYMMAKYPDSNQWMLPWLYIRRALEGFNKHSRK